MCSNCPVSVWVWLLAAFFQNKAAVKYMSFLLQDVKVFSEDGTCKVVEILADMTARDLCQLLVYKSHCVDDNSWTLVEHHPLLGLGRRPSGMESCLKLNVQFVTIKGSGFYSE